MKDYTENINNMINTIKEYGVTDAKVICAMSKVKRHKYIPKLYLAGCDNPYADEPFPIGFGQTISQPFIVAYMTELLSVSAGHKVLEIGTGSAYQSAILCELGVDLVSIEVIPELAEQAELLLKSEGYNNFCIKNGDGYNGCPEESPFDAIISTCAPPQLPQNLLSQLKDGGRMVIPIGDKKQQLCLFEKRDGKLFSKKVLDVLFVPMVSRDKTG